MDQHPKASDREAVAVQAAISADARSATVTAAAKPAPEPEPKTFTGKIGWLSRRLDRAVLESDGEEIGRLYEEHAALKASGPAEETAVKALGYRLHHFAPRKLAKIREIEATFHASTDPKSRGVGQSPPPAEHPAVKKAKADLADLDAQAQGNIPIPQDDEAIAALNDKLAKVQPPGA